MDVLAIFFWSMGLFRIGAGAINSSLPLLLFASAYVMLAWLRWRDLPIRLLLLTVTIAEFQYLELFQLPFTLPSWGALVFRNALYLGLMVQVLYLMMALMEAMTYALNKRRY